MKSIKITWKRAVKYSLPVLTVYMLRACSRVTTHIRSCGSCSDCAYRLEGYFGISLSHKINVVKIFVCYVNMYMILAA